MMADALAALAPVPGEATLDVGIGGGWLSGRLIAAGCRVTGVDPSETAISRARSRHPGAEFRVGHAQALPFDDGAFDAVACVNVLYFWPELAPPMREFQRVLRPGGRLVLGFQTADQVRAWPGHVHGFVAHDTQHILAAVDAAGFVPEAVRAGWHRRTGDYRTLVALRPGA
jgi:SAM-dependent methyltransferase